MNGKIHDPKAFPTEIPAAPTGRNGAGVVHTLTVAIGLAGFPETFLLR